MIAKFLREYGLAYSIAMMVIAIYLAELFGLVRVGTSIILCLLLLVASIVNVICALFLQNPTK